MLFNRLSFNSVWSRLLAPLALIVGPTALLVVVLAYSLFASALTNLQTTQGTAVAGRATELRGWLNAAGRSLANEAFAANFVGADRCAALAAEFLRRNPGFSSVRFFDSSAAPCEAGAPIAEGGPPRGEANDDGYRLGSLGAQLWILADQTAGRTCVLIVDDKVLRDRLRPAAAVGETHVALVDGEGVPLVASPVSDGTWLPEKFTPSQRAWRALDRAGALTSFSSAPIEGSALRVLTRFDDVRLNAAWRRFLILCAAQLAMLAMLAFFYASAIRRHVVQWIRSLDEAARGLDFESPAQAPVVASMPRELRSVAESFNAMADHAYRHQQALRASLAENRALMLEMHHRIKNSLQVIQSYLALIRRAADRPEALVLARIEARVGVLAVAYRLALTPSGIRPIAVKPFLEEICAAAVGGLRRPRQRAVYAIVWDGDLVIDRAIPLGLGLVEALIAALSAAEAGYVGVRLASDIDGAVELKIDSDAAPAASGLPDKVMRGLANQLGADSGPDVGGGILFWRFQP